MKIYNLLSEEPDEDYINGSRQTPFQAGRAGSRIAGMGGGEFS